ncbi:MAG: hypoxanthine phosphoribosyltransferase [Christensenellales bacterium]|jgi:hypoxanthine phosphoribosyltransferase
MSSNDIERILITREEIQKRVKELAKEISNDYRGKKLLVLCILKGASVFFADLMRELQVEVTFEFIGLSSYRNNAVSSGEVTLIKDMTSSVEGRDVLVVEDIIDTGLTLTYLKRLLKERGASSVKICTFLDKKAKRKAPLTGDYVGFEVPDEFLVGYGLDYAEKYRNLSDVCILKKEVYEKQN